MNCRCGFKVFVELSDPLKQGKTSELLLITQMLAPAVLLSGWTLQELPLFCTRCFLVYDKFFGAVPLKVSSQDRFLVQLECLLS